MKRLSWIRTLPTLGAIVPMFRWKLCLYPLKTCPANSPLPSSAGAPPDLFLAPHDLIEPLSADRLIKPITPWVTESTLIPYLLEATDAMRHSGELYGLPQSLDTTVLYYNTDLVSEPEQQLLDLFASATNSAPLALEIPVLMGLSGERPSLVENCFRLAKGGQNETLDIRRTSLVDWLGWLQSNKDRAGVVMNSDPGEAYRDVFGWQCCLSDHRI